jgi:hypothetical protein
MIFIILRGYDFNKCKNKKKKNSFLQIERKKKKNFSQITQILVLADYNKGRGTRDKGQGTRDKG